MPKRAALEPSKTKKEHAPWVVNLPPSLSATGKRERRYFDTKKEAATFCSQQRIRLENYGTASSILPAGKVEEALAAFEKLKPTGASLVAAAEFFVEAFRRRASSVTFGELLQRTADAKSGLSAAYKAQIRQALNRFSSLNDRAAVEVTATEIDAIANTAPASMRNGLLRILRAAYNLGIKKEWCRCENPVHRLDFSKVRRDTTVLLNEQVSTLLKTCIETDFPLLPYFLFTIFAGVRPEEVVRLDWEAHVDLDENFIEIADQHSKTKLRRIVEMEDLLIRWLSFYRASGGNTSGPVAPGNLRRRLRAVRQCAGIVDWPADAPRRTYASCHLAFFNDVDRLCRLLGHKSPAMLWEHYYKAVTKKRAAQFWEIEPPKSDRKIVSFAAQA